MGELLQMVSRCDFYQTIEAYDAKIERKTAALLGACTYGGALVSGIEERDALALKRYGTLLGMAFQMADDVLDYVATEEQVGKPTGADLKQGTVTLPLMYALDDPAVAPRLRDVLAREHLRDEDYEEVVRLVRGSTAIARSEARAHEFADRARAELVLFPGSPARRTLESLCDYVVERRY
jgi:geranylgeranyl pyrophosphate synthase